MPTGWRRSPRPARPRRERCSVRASWRSTIDQGEHTQRYQGIVELDGTPLEAAARTYFRQSEQIPTEIRLEVAKLVRPGNDGPREEWRAGGLIAQFLPEAPERLAMPDLPGGDGDTGEAAAVEIDNAWLEGQALISTIEPTELIDPTIEPERLLYRLFHEHGVRVFPGTRRGGRMLVLTQPHPRHPGRIFGRGDRREHRGRQHPRQLRILLEGVRVRPGGVCVNCSSPPTRGRLAASASQFTVRFLPGRSSENAGISTSNSSPRSLRIV